jgi:hypothetical protein
MQSGLRRAGALAVVFAAAVFARGAAAQARDVSGDTCAQYVSAYKEGAAGYEPYLRIVATMAQSRDALGGGIRNTVAYRGAKPEANAKALDAWCGEHPDKKVAEATRRLLDTLTGETSPAVIVEPAPAAMPAPAPLRKPQAAQPAPAAQ